MTAKEKQQINNIGEPLKLYAWQTGIGLQRVDGLETSDRLREIARMEIKGEIGIDRAEKLVQEHYACLGSLSAEDQDRFEADLASVHIRRILAENAFAFSLAGLTSIHRSIFNGIFKFAGKIRDYDVAKKERVLRGDTVLYVPASEIRQALEYDLLQERSFEYSKANEECLVRHVARMVSGLWQIHPFGEGNTRAIAVFTILYLRSLGMEETNSLFAENSLYFRNALVRANYQNLSKGIMLDTGYLERFFGNFLFGRTNELRNSDMIIRET